MSNQLKLLFWLAIVAAGMVLSLRIQAVHAASSALPEVREGCSYSDWTTLGGDVQRTYASKGGCVLGGLTEIWRYDSPKKERYPNSSIFDQVWAFGPAVLADKDGLYAPINHSATGICKYGGRNESAPGLIRLSHDGKDKGRDCAFIGRYQGGASAAVSMWKVTQNSKVMIDAIFNDQDGSYICGRTTKGCGGAGTGDSTGEQVQIGEIMVVLDLGGPDGAGPRLYGKARSGWRWKKTRPWGTRSRIAGDDQTLYLAGGPIAKAERGVYAIDPVNGAIKWFKEMAVTKAPRYETALAVGPELVYVYQGGDGKVVALKKSDGAKVWEADGYISTNSQGTKFDFVLSGNTLVTQKKSGSTVAIQSLNATTGAVLWASAPLTYAWNYASAASGSNTLLVLGWASSGVSSLTSYNLTNGNRIWQQNLKGQNFTIYGDRVLVHDRKGGSYDRLVAYEDRSQRKDARASAPQIVNQPADQTATVSDTVTLTVGVSGTPPFSYQWFRNGQTISNATAASYSFTAADADNGAKFKVKVSNSVGSVESREATLTISGALKIKTRLPSSLIVPDGSSATLSVEVLGAPPISYQWTRDGQVIEGANSASYLTPPLIFEAAKANSRNFVPVNFGFKATNSSGSVTDRTTAVVIERFEVDQQPKNLTINAGKGAVFSLTLKPLVKTRLTICKAYLRQLRSDNTWTGWWEVKPSGYQKYTLSQSSCSVTLANRQKAHTNSELKFLLTGNPASLYSVESQSAKLTVN